MTTSAAEVLGLFSEAGGGESQYWRYRELFYFLAWRDMLVCYKQTVIGVVQAVVRPLLTMSAFTIIVSKVAELSSNIPYALLVFSALLPWQFCHVPRRQHGAMILARAVRVGFMAMFFLWWGI